MRKYLIVLVLLPVLLLTSCSDVLNPKVMAATTQNVVQDIKTDNNQVFVEIQRNITLVVQLKDKVQTAQQNGQDLPFDEVLNDIKTIATSYESLASQRDSIKERLIAKVTAIDTMRGRVDTEVARLNARKAEYSSELQSLASSNADPEIVRTRNKALTKAISYVDAQVNLWNNFNNIEWDIASEMSNIQQRLDTFLSVIESSATLFREGLNLLQLQKDINDALSLFNMDMPTIERLTSDMEASWDNLDYLLETLTQFSNTMTITSNG